MDKIKIDIWEDFLIFTESEFDEDTISNALKRLENLLADCQASRARLGFLETLQMRAKQPDEKNERRTFRLLPNPLSIEETELCVKKGIVDSYKESLIEPDRLFKLAHSAEGIKQFTFALASSSPESTAPCWQEAFTVPFTVPDPIPLPNAEPGEKTNDSIEVIIEKPAITYIIYIDDIEDETRAITEVFKSRFEGAYRVRGFTSPGKALEFVREKEDAGHKIAAIVTDMYMPQEYHGDEFARRLHLVDPAIPVLGYSGHNQFQDPLEARKAGLVDLLPKQSTETSFLLDKVASLISA